MANYSPEQLLGFWEKGLPLSKALTEFTDPDIKYAPKQYNAGDLTPDNFLLMLENITGSSEYERKIKGDLSDKIKNGILIAIGYEPPMKSTDCPVIIPLHVWDNPEILTLKSSVTGNGLNFLSVRIIRKSILSKPEKPLDAGKINIPAPKIIDKSVGRPSQKNDLIMALEWMIKNNRADKTKSLKAHMGEIDFALGQIAPNSPYMGNLNYKTINRHLGKDFTRFKKSQNQSQI